MNKISHTLGSQHHCKFVLSFGQVVDYCNSIVLPKVTMGAFCNINERLYTCKFSRATKIEGAHAPVSA